MVQVSYGRVYATDLSKELADTSNLRKFFLRTVMTFQYPGGFLKSNQIKEINKAGILFNPFIWLTNFFMSDLRVEDSYITDVEFCHCVLNDLRVTSKHEDISITIDRILKNRENNIDYDATGDVKRYALDLLDYCVLAGVLLKDFKGKFFIKQDAVDFLIFFQKNSCLFSSYCNYKDDMHLSEIDSIKPLWITFVNEISEKLLVMFEDQVQSKLKDQGVDSIAVQVNTKEIGDQGEALAVAHEKIWLNNNGRVDLSKLVQHMPTQFAVGYDILSRELDATMRHIEVKTTVSQKSFTVNRVHLTPNEWLTAESHRDRYFIYRLRLSEEEKSLWIIRDPVGLYKADRLKMSPRNGADLTFDETCYEEVDLLRYHE